MDILTFSIKLIDVTLKEFAKCTKQLSTIYLFHLDIMNNSLMYMLFTRGNLTNSNCFNRSYLQISWITVFSDLLPSLFN